MTEPLHDPLKSPSPSTLLALPLELRTQIYTHLLQSTLPAPCISADWPREHPHSYVIWPKHTQSSSQSSTGTSSSASTESLPPIYLSSGLSLTCHQTNTEIRSLVRRKATLFPYHLDLCIPSASRCHPTWLCLPAPLHWYDSGPDSNTDAAAGNNGSGGRESSAEKAATERSKLDIDADVRVLNVPTSGNPWYDSFDEEPYGLRGNELRWGSDGGPGEAQIMLLMVLGHWCVNGVGFTKKSVGPPPSAQHGSNGGEQQGNGGRLIQARELRMHFVAWDQDMPTTPVGIRSYLGKDAPEKIGWRECDAFPHFQHWQALKWEMERLATCGLLYGRFEHLGLDVVASKVDEEVLQWKVCDQSEGDKWATAKEWAAYGWLPGKIESDRRT